MEHIIQSDTLIWYGVKFVLVQCIQLRVQWHCDNVSWSDDQFQQDKAVLGFPSWSCTNIFIVCVVYVLEITYYLRYERLSEVNILIMKTVC
jgi:hypothetical protein